MNISYEYIAPVSLTAEEVIRDYCMQWDGQLSILVTIMLVSYFFIDSFIPYIKEKTANSPTLFGLNMMTSKFGVPDILKSVSESFDGLLSLALFYMVGILIYQGTISIRELIIIGITGFFVLLLVIRNIYRRIKGLHKGNTSLDDLAKMIGGEIKDDEEEKDYEVKESDNIWD